MQHKIESDTLITFPVNGKIPSIKNWNSLHSSILTTKDSYGILTGKLNDIIVVDCDLLKSDDPNKYMCGVQAWNKLCHMYSFLKRLDIPIVQTQSGGLHLYFKYTDQLLSGIQKLNSDNLFFDNQHKTIKIDILSDNKFVVGPNGKNYKFINNTQYCNPPEFPSKLINIFSYKNLPIEESSEENNSSIHSDSCEATRSFTFDYLKSLVDKIPQDYCDNYQEWIKIVWAIAQTAIDNGFDALPIADDFSKKSEKYAGIEDVERVYFQNNGKITIASIIYILRKHDLLPNQELSQVNYDNLIHDLNNNLSLPNEITKLINIKDEPSNKLCEFSTENDKNLILKIYKDNLITTFHDNNFIGYLQSILNIKYDLSVIHPEFTDNCNVIFVDKETIDFVSKEENKGEHRMRIKHPWDPKKWYFTKFSYGKQIGSMRRNKQELFVMIDEALRKACHSHLESRYNMTVNVQGNIIFNQLANPDDKIRSEERFITDLIDCHKEILDCFKFCNNTNQGSFNGIYLYGPTTGIWRKDHNTTIEKMLSTRIKKYVPCLTSEELKYIETTKNIQQLRIMFIREIMDPDFEDNIDGNRNIFAMKNCVYDIEHRKIRKARPLDYIYTNSGWVYNDEEATIYLGDVSKFFEQLFPIEEERKIILTFIASLLHGYRFDKKFIALTDKRNGNNGKSTLISLLSCFFGDYMKTSSKFLLKGSFDKDKDAHDGGLEPMKGKRILVCDELKKHMKLDEGLIKNLAGGEYKVEGRRLGKADQFKFVWQAGIFMIFNEGDCPKFDATDNAFMERMVIVPMRSKFVSSDEDLPSFTFKRNPNINLKFPFWRSAVLKYLQNFASMEGLSHMKIPQSMCEWKEEIISENNELKDWLFSVIAESENKEDFVTLSELRDLYKKSFPLERNYKNKDIERMITNLFLNKGIYLRERYRPIINGKQSDKRNVFIGYLLHV